MFAKEDKPLAAIDFNAYRSKLTFTGAGVDQIEVSRLVGCFSGTIEIVVGVQNIG